MGELSNCNFLKAYLAAFSFSSAVTSAPKILVCSKNCFPLEVLPLRQYLRDKSSVCFLQLGQLLVESTLEVWWDCCKILLNVSLKLIGKVQKVSFGPRRHENTESIWTDNFNLAVEVS